MFDNVLLCLGSDIQNDDKNNKTVTTLFQSNAENTSGKARNITGGSITTDGSGIMYAVKGDKISTSYQQPFSLAYLDHATAPTSASYQYYMVTGSDEKQAERLLSSKSPIEVMKQDNDAHIVINKERGLVYGALFNEKIEHPSLKVCKVNIPLAYILQEKGKKQYTLSVCEPDMRRPSANHMGLLSEEDVLVTEKPFVTRLYLSGIYDATCPNGDIKVTHTEKQTVVELSTICGKNYTIELKGK